MPTYVEIDGQALALELPSMTATNEIMPILLGGDAAKGIVGDIAKRLQAAITGAQADAEAEATALGDPDIVKAVKARRVERAIDTAIRFAIDEAASLLPSLLDLFLPVIRDRGGLGIAVVVLDTEENRESLAANAEWVAKWGDPRSLKELPWQDAVHPTLRAEYSPALRKWAVRRLGGPAAMSIAISAVRLLLFGGALGKADGTPSQHSAPSVPTTTEPAPMDLQPTKDSVENSSLI